MKKIIILLLISLSFSTFAQKNTKYILRVKTANGDWSKTDDKVRVKITGLKASFYKWLDNPGNDMERNQVDQYVFNEIEIGELQAIKFWISDGNDKGTDINDWEISWVSLENLKRKTKDRANVNRYIGDNISKNMKMDVGVRFNTLKREHDREMQRKKNKRKKSPKPRSNKVTKTRFFTTKNCIYTVYKTPMGGTHFCENRVFVGVVRPNSSVSITIRGKESYAIWITKGSRNPCGKSKLSSTISIGIGEKSSTLIEELYDRECN